MDEWVKAILQNLIASGIASFFGVIFGVLVLQRYQRGQDEKKFGNWTVIVKRPGEKDVKRCIPIERAKLVLDDDSELSVYLKGIASPFGWINCDLVTEGVENKMLVRDNEHRTFIIDYACNPQRKPGQTNVGERNAAIGVSG